jgi:hypothetical protein
MSALRSSLKRIGAFVSSRTIQPRPEVKADTHLAPDGGGTYEGVIQRPYGPARVMITISTLNKLIGSPGGQLVLIRENPLNGGYPETQIGFSEFNKDPFDPKSRINDIKRDRVAR